MIETLTSLFDSMSNMLIDVWEWVSTSYDIFGHEFTVYEMIFGVGVTFVLGYIIVTWIGNIIT